MSTSTHRSSRYRRAAAFSGLAAGAIALIATFAWRAPAATDPATSAAPAALPSAQVARPLVATLPEIRTYPGHVEAIERVELRPRVAGALIEVHFAEGSDVARGALLARVDPRPFKAALAAAEATLARARAEEINAAQEAERAARLLERRAVAREEAEARATRVAVARAEVGEAEARVEKARLELSFTELRAPIAGRLGRIEVTIGNLVDPSTRIATLVATDPVYVRFDLDEGTATRAASTADWQVRFVPAGGAGGLEGELAFLDNEVATGTGTLRARARFANPGGELVAGSYGRVELVLGQRPDSLLVDDRAIGTDQGRRFVLVVDGEGLVEYRPVELGALHGDLRVIEKGLAADDLVLVTGLMRYGPGARIAPLEVAMEEVAASVLPSDLQASEKKG